MSLIKNVTRSIALLNTSMLCVTNKPIMLSFVMLDVDLVSCRGTFKERIWARGTFVYLLMGDGHSYIITKLIFQFKMAESRLNTLSFRLTTFSFVDIGKH
jgi:hypothetical protein